MSDSLLDFGFLCLYVFRCCGFDLVGAVAVDLAAVMGGSQHDDASGMCDIHGSSGILSKEQFFDDYVSWVVLIQD